VELGFVSSSSPYLPCLLSSPNSPLKNSKLTDRRSVKLRTTDGRRRTSYLRRRLGDWLKRKRLGDKRRRRNKNGRRRRNGGRGLRRPRRSMRGRRR
jgi:hypothetical protein